MFECRLCNLMKEKKRILYKDNMVSVMIPEEASAFGELIVLPNQHEILFENLPDEVAAHLGVIANKTSMALVSALNCEGTNLVVQSGEPAGQHYAHTFIRVIPRFRNDELNLSWEPQEIKEEEMEVIEIKLRDACDKIFFKKKEKNKEEFKAREKKLDKNEEEKYKFMLEHLKRIP